MLAPLSSIRATGVAALLLLALPVAASAQSSSSAARIARIDSVLSAAAEAGMNGVVRIRAADSTLLHRAYGLRDREASQPMSVEDGFDIGSLVKPITLAAVLKADEQGLLSLSDSVGQYFPQAPPEKRGITIRQLVTHTGGLDDYIGRDYELIGRDEALRRILASPLIGEPGGEEVYSNAGYTLLAILLEEVSGRSYEHYVREEVLEPAGTPGLAYVLGDWPVERQAVAYGPGGRRWGAPTEKPWLDDGVSWTFRGAGGMIGTAAQMGDWYEALFDGRVLGQQALSMFYAIDAGESASVGGLALAHAGGNGVFNTLQVSWIEHDVHLTFFTSTAAPHNAESVWDRIRDDVIALAREAARGRVRPGSDLVESVDRPS